MAGLQDCQLTNQSRTPAILQFRNVACRHLPGGVYDTPFFTA